MADAVYSPIGQINSAGDEKALFLKVFSGMVINTFDETNKMMDKHVVRSIASGKSAQFPVLGTATAAYHVKGEDISPNGQEILANEKIINIDNSLLAPVFIPSIDEAMNHYDVRAEYARKLAHELANRADKNLLQVAVLAARASATLTGGNGGTVLTNAAYGTDGDVLAAGIFDAGQTFDEKDIPEDSQRFCALKPAQYNLLAQTTKVLNSDWNGAGSYSKGQVTEIDSIQVIKSNHVPTSVIAGVTGENNTYSGTFTTTVGVCWHKNAVGTVKLQDLRSESEYNMLQQGTWLLSKYIMGHGILQPECAVELKTS